MILHLLGDPIDSLGLLPQVQAWSHFDRVRLRELPRDNWTDCKRVLGAIVGPMEDVTKPNKNLIEVFYELIHQQNRPKMGPEELKKNREQSVSEMADT